MPGLIFGALVFCAVDLSGIFYNNKIMSFSNIHYGVHVTGMAIDMHWHNRYSAFGDLFFYLADIHTVGLWVTVD